MNNCPLSKLKKSLPPRLADNPHLRRDIEWQEHQASSTPASRLAKQHLKEVREFFERLSAAELESIPRLIRDGERFPVPSAQRMRDHLDWGGGTIPDAYRGKKAPPKVPSNVVVVEADAGLFLPVEVWESLGGFDRADWCKVALDWAGIIRTKQIQWISAGLSGAKQEERLCRLGRRAARRAARAGAPGWVDESCIRLLVRRFAHRRGAAERWSMKRLLRMLRDGSLESVLHEHEYQLRLWKERQELRNTFRDAKVVEEDSDHKQRRWS